MAEGFIPGASSQCADSGFDGIHTRSGRRRRASAPQVNEKAGCVPSVSASAASWQLPRVEYYSWVVVRKPLITKWHLRIRWRKKKKEKRNTDIDPLRLRKEVTRSHESCGRVNGVHRDNGAGLDAWPLEQWKVAAVLYCEGILLSPVEVVSENG